MAMQTNLEALIDAANHLSDEERKKLVEALHPCSDSPQPRHYVHSLRGKFKGKGLLEELMAEKQRERKL